MLFDLKVSGLNEQQNRYSLLNSEKAQSFSESK